MKKVLMGIGSVAGVIAGGLIIWNAVLPFIGKVFSMFGTLFNTVVSNFF